MAQQRRNLLVSLALAVWLTTSAQPASAVGLTMSAQQATAQADATQSVEALRTAINASDVDRSTDLFAQDAVVIQPRIGGLPQIYLGQEQIRWWLRNLADQHAHWTVAQPTRLVSDQDVQWSDNVSVDAFHALQIESVEVRSEAVLNSDGRIAALTSVFTPAAALSLQ